MVPDVGHVLDARDLLGDHVSVLHGHQGGRDTHQVRDVAGPGTRAVDDALGLDVTERRGHPLDGRRAETTRAGHDIRHRAVLYHLGGGDGEGGRNRDGKCEGEAEEVLTFAPALVADLLRAVQRP